MVSHYSPKTFLRHTSNSLLKECFAHEGALTDIPWSNLPVHQVDIVYDAWQELPEAERIAIERQFEDADELANEQGIQTIIEEGQFHGLDLTSELEQFDGHRDKAMWVALHHPRVFEVAGIINRAHSLPQRYCRRRNGIPAQQPDVSPEAIDGFANAIGAYYRQTHPQGREHAWIDDIAKVSANCISDLMSHVVSQNSVPQNITISCKSAFTEALAEQSAGNLVLLAIMVDNEGKTQLPGMPGGRGGALYALSHVIVRTGDDVSLLAFALFDPRNRAGAFDRWLQPARRSGAAVLADRRLSGIQKSGDAATMWAACVATTLWDTQWRIETEFPKVFQFSAFAASVETWNWLSCSDEGKIVNAGLEESTRGKSRSKKETPTKRSWTQADLDGEIREYKAKRAGTYNDLVEGVKGGQPGAKKAARELFGRNVIVRALGVKSGAMVTNSPAWQEIADDLGLRGQSKKSGQASGQRIGMEIALEEQAVASGESVVDQVVRRETITLVEKSMPAAEAEATIEKLQRREITDDQARELINVLAE